MPGRLDLDELLATVDVLSLHCPLTPATQGMIGAARLARMKRDAVLINTARGALVDSAALADALRAGRLGGAAIDVLSQEPPVDGNPLLAGDIPNLIVTPHVAWAAREARQRCLDELAANVEDFRAGRAKSGEAWAAWPWRGRSAREPAGSRQSIAAQLSTGCTRGETSSIASSKLTQRNSLCSGRPISGLTGNVTSTVSACAR